MPKANFTTNYETDKLTIYCHQKDKIGLVKAVAG
jgi:hypothetical protein